MTVIPPARGPALGFVGDLCLSLDVINTVRRRGAEFLFAPVRPLHEQLDLVVGNLESCITDQGPSEPPLRPPLNTPLDVAEALKTSGIDVFGLANNHVMDFGGEGLRSTIEYLDRCGFRHFGAGMTVQEAEAPLHLEVAGVRLALLGACEFTASWAANNRPGVAPLVKRRLWRRIAEAKKTADLVIVVLHADLEFVRHPAPWRQRLSRSLIERGAAMVIQHHPHVCQGIERYMGGLIAYSLGNHVFQVDDNEYQAGCSGTAASMLLQVNIDRGDLAPNPTPHPLRIDENHRPVPCDSAAAERQNREIEQLSRQLLDPGAVRDVWRSTCWQQVYRSTLGTYYTLRKKGIASAIAEDTAILRNTENFRWLYGFFSAGFR